MLSGFLRRRSAGIRDLRHGSLVDEDWRGRDPEALRAVACQEVPLLPWATHFFVSATVTRNPKHPLGRLLGDILVLEPSASGQGRTRRIPFRDEHGHHVGAPTTSRCSTTLRSTTACAAGSNGARGPRGSRLRLDGVTLLNAGPTAGCAENACRSPGVQEVKTPAVIWARTPVRPSPSSLRMAPRVGGRTVETKTVAAKGESAGRESRPDSRECSGNGTHVLRRRQIPDPRSCRAG